MADLIREYFDRDFSLEELDGLERLLEGPEENAERFAALAAAFCADAGIQEVLTVKRRLRPWLGWMIALAAVGATALWVAFDQETQDSAEQSAVPALDSGGLAGPAAELAPSGRLQAPSLKHEDLKRTPQRRTDGNERSGISALVDAGFPAPPTPQKAPAGLTLGISETKQGFVSVRVLNARGEPVRRLYFGVMEIGSHVLTWDGLDDQGRRAADGAYGIDIAQDGRHSVVNVTLGPVPKTP